LFIIVILVVARFDGLAPSVVGIVVVALWALLEVIHFARIVISIRGRDCRCSFVDEGSLVMVHLPLSVEPWRRRRCCALLLLLCISLQVTDKIFQQSIHIHLALYLFLSSYSIGLGCFFFWYCVVPCSKGFMVADDLPTMIEAAQKQ
jgi:hypothetical protein